MNIKGTALRWVSTVYNGLVDLRPRGEPPPAALAELREVQRQARRRTDISDHLVTLFTQALDVKPKLIVELGVRGGESTFVFERVARLCDATLVSVDIRDCAEVCEYGRWHFVRNDDIAFGREFVAWCRERSIEPRIDVLFIDTSHLYEHTRREIETWLPLLSPNGKVFFHDSHLRTVYFRSDGSMGIGWDNDRGVMRALEEHFGTRFHETRDFVDVRDGWRIEHRAICNGLTILSRRPTQTD